MRKLVIIAFCLLFSITLFGCVDLNAIIEPAADSENAVQTEQNHENNNDSSTSETIQEAPRDEEPDSETNNEDENNGTEDWVPGIFPFSFTAQDLYGDTITEESMGERKMFFLHLWGTWCPPCVNEMPDLAEIARKYGDRVGFLGLLDDFSTNPDGAKKILESADMPEFFFNVDARLPELQDLVILVSSGAVPTTVIITSDGRITEQLVGAYGPAYTYVLDHLLETG